MAFIYKSHHPPDKDFVNTFNEALVKHLYTLLALALTFVGCNGNFQVEKPIPDGGVTQIQNHENLGRVSTLAGTAGVIGSSDGIGPVAEFNMPFGIVTDSSENIFVADYMNSIIRKITPDGTVSTYAGTAGVYGAVDGNRSTATFYVPAAIAIDSADNLYIADSGNNTIRKITANGDVTTLAGIAGMPGYADGSGTSTQFNMPAGIVVDKTGHIYVSDLGNQVIRKITPTGIVTTFAGIAGQSGSTDGDRLTGLLGGPYGLVIDKNENVYVADYANSNIRKITPAGYITTIAGDSTNPGHVDGVGTAASFLYPAGITIDNAGILYVADFANHLIRKIAQDGTVTTFAGSVTGHSDGTGVAAEFYGPAGITYNKVSGSIYVSDTGNNTVRKIR